MQMRWVVAQSSDLILIIALSVYFCVFEEDFGNLTYFVLFQGCYLYQYYSAVLCSEHYPPEGAEAKNCQILICLPIPYCRSSLPLHRSLDSGLCPQVSLGAGENYVENQTSGCSLTQPCSLNIRTIEKQGYTWLLLRSSLKHEVQLPLVISSKRKKPAASLLYTHLQKGAGFSPWYTFLIYKNEACECSSNQQR